MFNRKVSEGFVRIDDHTLAPISQSAATVTTGWVSVANWDRIIATVNVGVMGSSSTVDAKLQQATSSAGAGAKDISGKAITQLTQTPTNKSGTSSSIDCRADELDVANGFGYVRLSVTVGTAASLISGSIHGADPKLGPASDFDDSHVNEYI